MRRLFLVISYIFLLLPCQGRAEAGNYIFEHIQTSTHWINDIYQDRDGFMWVSARNGLFRYLGDETNAYETVYEGDIFYDICQDAEGLIWVKKRNGYVIYDPTIGQFKDEVETAAILGSQNWISILDIDEKMNLWWSDEGQILVRRNGKDERLTVGIIEGQIYDIFCRNDISYVLTSDGRLYRFSLDPSGAVRTFPVLCPLRGGDGFYCVFVDSDSNIWISQGYHGVWYYKAGSDEPIHFSSASKTNSIQRGFISAIEEDPDGNVWLASDHGGITICSKNAQIVKYLKNDPADANTLASNGVYTLSTDRKGNVWVGYTKKGLSVYKGQNKTWSINHLNVLHENNLMDDINTTCEDLDGNLWFGTDGQGLICLDRSSGQETIYTVANSSLRSNVITDIHCDDTGRIWIGTFYGGLSCIESGRMTTYSYEADGSGLLSDNVWSIDNDKSGNIWIGMLGGGVQSLNPETGVFESIRSEDALLSNNSVLELECCDDGMIYIATSYGLTILDPQQKTSRIVCSPDDMVQESLTGVTVDSRGLVWLDEDGILQIYDSSIGKFYTPNHSALKTVRGVIEDKSGYVWVVTDTGLCRVTVYRSIEQGYAFEYASFSFPQQTDLHFNQRSICLTSDGIFIIGSFCGYMKFAPDMYASDSSEDPAVLHFVELYIGNQLIYPGVAYDGDVILEKKLEHADEIVLDHDASNVSIRYSCLDYLSVKDRNLYYKMEGLSDEWLSVSDNTDRLTFMNLPAGKYRLVLSDSTKDLAGSISLSVRILPPWWATWWAVMIYLAIAVIALTIVWMVMKRRKTIRERQLEHAMMQERRHYVDEMKMQFFTNVSHDFRTPLTLILTPVEEMLSRNPQLKDDAFIATIHRNAQRLLNLVNEVLDLRRMETYGTELSLKQADLVSVVRDAVSSFMLMAENQKITLSVNTSAEKIEFEFDEGKIVKVLTNLLSNAFKFTPKGGDITVDVKVEEGFANISVCDTGTGVADKDKRRIFDRFYQANNSPAGSGIGLHVVREFIILHGGDVFIEDNSPSGAIFRCTLPVLRKKTIQEEPATGLTGTEDPKSDSALPTILVVDDNDDFRVFMKTSLASEYNVLEASDGAEALSVVSDNDVDVVISDVMMPNVDGTELCRRMKSDINTSHIPVILLTAKAMQDDECHGLESGADDYLTKPFNMSILRLRIAKFIEWKNRSKKIFDKEIEITTEQITLTSIDDRLLQQAINVINENISNPEFSVSELSAALCMHRANLYKKLLYITGKTPMEFIRAIRLKRAAALLETDGVYVSEIAYMVGFNSPKVFAGHFKEEFGCSPSEYRKKYNINN